MSSFQFLYWIDSYDSDKMKEKIYKCKSIKKACAKFLKWVNNYKGKVVKVDYEVRQNKDVFIDISNYKGFENLI